MIRSPMSLPAGALFSESAIARARKAYKAGPALCGPLALRCESIASKQTGKTTVAKGRVALRRMASATATRIGEAGLMRLRSRASRNFSRSSMVTRPPAPLPAIPAMSAA